MKRIYRLCLGLSMLGFCNYAVAQTSLGTSKSLLGELKKDLSSRTTSRTISSVDLDIPGSSFQGKVNYKESGASSEFLIGEVEGIAGSSFYIKASDKSLEGHIILKATKKAYKYYSDATGNAFVDEVNINSVVCIDYENLPSKKQKSEAQAKEAAAISPALLNLQSLPGAAGVVMLDFDGYYMPSGNYWNNGNAIDAAPSGMSDDAVREHWEVVSEDYRPFNVNITTNEAVFNSYPKNRRMRVVVTPTNTAAPGAGGVAYIGSFNWDNDVPCWVFITSGKSGGDASSHEIGHCFDLQHDARSNPSEGYFLGLDNTAWAPIMGAGYYRPIVQWSKGEYNYAKNDGNVLQDDVATIAGSKFGVGYRGDDYANNTSTTATLDYNTSGAITQKSGVITSEADIDFFKFTTGGGNIVINANTVSRDGNLDIIIRLYNSAGQEIANANPTTPMVITAGNRDAQFYAALNATLNTNVAAGTYYVSIDGTGANDPKIGGYSAYGSLGSYFITGTIPPATTVANSDGFAIFAKDCAYGGYNIGLNEGSYTRADLISKGISDDDISSIKVKQGFKVIVYKDDNYTGTSLTVTGDKDCLVADGFNDVITSLKVVPNGVTGLAGTYYVQNRFSGLYLDVPGSSSDNIQLQQYTYNGSAAQQYTLTDLGSGVYKITNINSGKALDVDGINTADGIKVQQWPYLGSANQQWIMVASDAGYYKLIARHSAKVLEIGGWSTVNGGLAQQWTNNNQTSGQWKIAPVQAVIGTGDGLLGSYYNGMNFETARLYRKDANINFNWGNGSPDATRVNADGFSVRWTGQVQAKYSGPVTFIINSDNGRRLWVNGQLLVDQWVDNWGTDYTGTITLTAGQKYDIKVEYFENYGGAGAKLEWSSALLAREVIPTSQLYAPPIPTNPVIDQPNTNIAPTVSLTSPANNATYTAAASINITANASDADGTVAKVEFYNGATKLGEDASAPYAYTWSGVAAGSYTITVKSIDDKGASASASVSIKVNPQPNVNVAPTVSITSPSNGATFTAPASINVTANASDADGTVAKVEFYNGATKLGEDASAPYAYTVSGLAAGTYTLTAKSIDDKGASASASVTVTVNPVVVVDNCTGVSAYVENNGYIAGSKVKNVGRKYECKEWPFSGWCTGAAWAYAPGTGAYWTDAWYDRGTCTPTTGGSSSEESSTTESLSLSPNPVQGDLNISSTYSLSGASVMIIDVTGKTVYQSNASESISTADMNAGVYTLIMVTSDGQKISKRFVKIK